MNDERHAPCLAPVRRLKIGAPPCLSPCPSVCDTFVMFQKRGFEIANIHAGVSSNKNDKFEHVHMQKNEHF